MCSLCSPDNDPELFESPWQDRQERAVEEVQDIVEETLIQNRRIKIAKSYILYRDQRARIREMENSMIDSNELMEKYLSNADWKIKENSNI